MSRRSRRKKPAGERRWVGKAAVALLVVGVILLGSVYAAVRGYLRSEGFRKFLSAEAGAATGVSGEFAPFHWDGLAVDTDRFEATGEGMLAAVQAEGLHTEVALGGLGRGVWEIRGSSVRRLEVTVDATRPMTKPKAERVKRQEKSVAKSSRPSWLPSDTELQSLDLKSVSANVKLEQGPASVRGMSLRAELSGGNGAYHGELQDGTVRLPFRFLPELRLDSAQLRYQDEHVFLTKAMVTAWQNTRIKASGEWDLDSRQFSLQGDAEGIRCEDLLGGDWAKRLTGGIRSDFAVSNSRGDISANGNLILTEGVLTALPMLDALAAYADTRRFRVLTLSESRCRWSWKKDELALSELVLASEGLVRLEGSLTLRGDQLDGVFRLGLAAGTLSSIPGAETDVFIRGERGLLWAPLRITGTLDDPKEDLTDRLINAAGMRMFDRIPETGEKVVKFTKTVIDELPPGAVNKGLEKGVKIIEKSGKAVRKVTGILDDLLGTDVLPPETKEEP